MENTSIGFVGLGHMGGAMAVRLLEAGYPVHGTDRTRAHAASLIEGGLQWHDTPREVAEAVDVVLTSLPGDDVLRAVADGENGLLAGLAPSAIWLDVSTVSPRLSREIAAQARERGLTMLDAPVSGSVPQVQSGSLTIMVGGDQDAYDRVEPVLRVLGTPTHVGENGHGEVLKLAVNISLAVQMLALAEGLRLAERAGLDEKLALHVMTNSSIGSPMLKAREPLVLDLPEDAWFSIALMRKDIELALDTARELGVQLPTAHTADTVLHDAEELGYDDRDLASLYEVLGSTSR
jgi:3-hydroxyisobutyrate dehydrogenase-like beta-hydroxyacid dehydrogenase